MKVTIDRFEGDFAVVEKEDKTFFNLPLPLVPDGAKEGSVLSILRDESEEEARRERIEKKARRLWAD
jgi:hypothetical protein